MFYLRGLLVALSEFVLLYVVCSVLVCCFWRQVQRWSRGLTAHSAANLLYALRVSPLAVPFSVVMGLSVPSFLRFEPHASSESLGAVTIVLPAIFVLFALTSGGRAWQAYARTQRSIRDWTVSATRLEAGADVDCFQSEQGAPPVALARIRGPARVISP